MKRVITLMIALLSVTQIYAQQLDGFWGIPWKYSLNKVNLIMESKELYNESHSKDALSYTDVLFAGRNGKLYLFFDNDRFYSSSFQIQPEKNKALVEYTRLKNDLIKKYGTPTMDEEEYLYPYEKGDGHEEMAIAGNNTNIDCSWWFDNSSAILLSLEGEDYKILLKLSYYCGEIMEERMQKKTESINNDL